MRPIRILIGTWVVVLMLGVDLSHAQENLHAQLFQDADKALATARERKADLYAPKSFRRALEYYTEAEDFFKRGKSLDDIRSRLQSAVTHFAKAVESSRLAEITFNTAIAARADAVSATAMKFAPELWTKAEAHFTSAAEDLEDGNLSSARSEAGEAQGEYRSAELEAIKANFLTPARELLRRADIMDAKQNAPRTMDRARSLTSRVETMLQQNRYNNAEARKLAEEARYEAAHAIYLHQAIERLKQQDRGAEEILLSAEDPLQRIAAFLGVPAHFDRGFDPVAQQILDEIRSRDSVARTAPTTLNRQDAEIVALRQKVAMLEAKLTPYLAAEQEQQKKTERIRSLDQQVGSLAPMFSRDEGIVVRDGNNVVLRLHGITFAPGKNTIDSRHLALLGRVQDAIRRFPGCQVTIEGHTDSHGSELANQQLSQVRAEAVLQHLKAGLGPSIPLLAVGYGGARAVADNTTFEGRARNRRIEIVIVPEWAIVGK